MLGFGLKDYICPICGNYSLGYEDHPECNFCHNANTRVFTDDEIKQCLREIDNQQFAKYAKDDPWFLHIKPDDMEQIHEYLRQKFVYNSPDFNQGLCDLRVRQHEEAMAKEAQARRDRERTEREATRPRCPTCHSTDIKPITVTQKTGSFLMLGIFSQKIKHQFHCNHCGYEW